MPRQAKQKRAKYVLIESIGSEGHQFHYRGAWHSSHFWGIQRESGYFCFAIMDHEPRRVVRQSLPPLAQYNGIHARTRATIKPDEKLVKLLNQLHRNEPKGLVDGQMKRFLGKIKPIDLRQSEERFIVEIIQKERAKLSSQEK